jgi:hypothetical protein
MRASEILNENPVESTWIVNLMYNRPNKVLTMRLSDGRAYSIPGITRGTFDQWIKSNSKGEFFHNRIRDIYNINKIQ